MTAFARNRFHRGIKIRQCLYTRYQFNRLPYNYQELCLLYFYYTILINQLMIVPFYSVEFQNTYNIHQKQTIINQFILIILYI